MFKKTETIQEIGMNIFGVGLVETNRKHTDETYAIHGKIVMMGDTHIQAKMFQTQETAQQQRFVKKI